MSPPASVPGRITWAIDVLSVKPADRLLEIGCGSGVAMALICQRLRKGRITGIDRSSTAIVSAERRLAGCLDAGRARLMHMPLAEYSSAGEGFNKVFSINVNVFWLSPTRELAVVRQLLAPRGRLYLYFEPPSHAQVDRLLMACTRHLQLEGFRIADVVRRAPVFRPGVAIVAR